MEKMTTKRAKTGCNCKDFGIDGGGCSRKNQVRMKSLTDIRRFLARVLNDLDRNLIQESKARTLGYLCAVMRDVIKDSDLEIRVAKLEREMEKNEPA